MLVAPDFTPVLFQTSVASKLANLLSVQPCCLIWYYHHLHFTKLIKNIHWIAFYDLLDGLPHPFCSRLTDCELMIFQTAVITI